MTTAVAELPEHARVVLRCKSGPELADLITDCLDAGLVVVPVAPGTPDDELDRLAPPI